MSRWVERSHAVTAHIIKMPPGNTTPACAVRCWTEIWFLKIGWGEKTEVTQRCKSTQEPSRDPANCTLGKEVPIFPWEEQHQGSSFKSPFGWTTESRFKTQRVFCLIAVASAQCNYKQTRWLQKLTKISAQFSGDNKSTRRPKERSLWLDNPWFTQKYQQGYSQRWKKHLEKNIPWLCLEDWLLKLQI